ncbi:MAG TPA: methyltransferase domain-containing protein [Candidatus Baltobacteraceae bacterium]|nr:methyltransferase domain-containing protein [Candidatus Baltobacteraceae bacterium]
MKFNSNRTKRLAFDEVAVSYDSARPSFSRKIVADLTAQANLKPGSSVLEVGSGTGQLTLALLREGLLVTALEPGDALREKLIENTRGRENILVRPEFLEEFADGNAPFDAIISANAWQWIDPAVGYSHAAKLLRPRGALGVLWNFPVISDLRLQERLNKEVFQKSGLILCRRMILWNAFERLHARVG